MSESRGVLRCGTLTWSDEFNSRKGHHGAATVKNHMNKQQPITVDVDVRAPMARVWECFTQSEHIVGWAFASDE